MVFSFNGRIGRSTYWMILIPLFMVGVTLNVLAIVESELAGLWLLLSVPVVWIACTTYVKRWHDLNRSAWLILTLFIPIVNLFVVVYLGLAPGTPGPNGYGRDPQEIGGESTK